MKKLSLLLLFTFFSSFALTTQERELLAQKGQLNKQLDVLTRQISKESADPIKNIDNHVNYITIVYKLQVINFLLPSANGHPKTPSAGDADQIQRNLLASITEVPTYDLPLNKLITRVIEQIETREDQNDIESVIAILVTLSQIRKVGKIPFLKLDKKELLNDILRLYILMNKLMEQQEQLQNQATFKYNKKIYNKYKKQIKYFIHRLTTMSSDLMGQVIELDVQSFDPKAQNAEQMLALINRLRDALYRQFSAVNDEWKSFKTRYDAFIQSFIKDLTFQQGQEKKGEVIRLKNELTEFQNKFLQLKVYYEYLSKFVGFTIGIITTIQRRYVDPNVGETYETLFEKLLEYYAGQFNNESPTRAYEILFTPEIAQELHANKITNKGSIIHDKVTTNLAAKAYALAEQKSRTPHINARNASYIIKNKFERAMYDAFLQDYAALRKQGLIEDTKVVPRARKYLKKQGRVEKLRLSKEQSDALLETFANIQDMLQKVQREIAEKVDALLQDANMKERALNAILEDIDGIIDLS